MNACTRCLVASLVLTAIAVSAGAQAKGSGGGGKTSGWSLSPTPSSGPTMAGLPIGDSTGAFQGGGKGRGSAQGYDALGNAGTMGMGSMMITPNGMIAHNTPPETIVSVNGLAGSSSVSKLTRGEGNSQVGVLARGVGNSQGSGGTMDIAQMTHFGVSGMAFASSIIGASGVNIGSLLGQFLSSPGGSAAAMPGSGGSLPPGAGSSGAHGATKAQLLGAPTNHACVTTAGAKSGCG